MTTGGGAAEPRVFTIGGLAGMIGSSRRVLEGALAPFPGAAGDPEGLFAEPLAEGGVLPGPGNVVVRLPEVPVCPLGRPIEPGAAVGWVCGALPAPFRDDRYIVEFTGRNEVRVLAYLDRFGRVFTADEPSEVPPARVPDLAFVRDEEASAGGDEAGWVVVSAGGEERRVARYRVRNGRYDLFDSWYGFGAAGEGLAYPDALARAYLACVHRPSITGTPVPSSGLGCIFELLGSSNPVRALRAVCLLVERARRDPALRPPALASLLVAWLDEAGFTDRVSRGWLIGADAEGPLRLIRTRRYADTFYLAVSDEDAGVPEQTVWAVESALNRFLLLADALGERAAVADEAECARWDEGLRRALVDQAADAACPADAEAPEPAGEWAARVAVAEAMERLRVPVRFQAAFDLDVAEPGAAAFLLTAPGAAFMPARRYDAESGCWAEQPPAAREAEARAYAARLGIALAASAFAASRTVDEVMVTAVPLLDDADMAAAAAGDAGEGAADGEGRLSWSEAAALALAADDALAAAADAPGPAVDGPFFYQVVFDRARFTGGGAYCDAAASNPLGFLASFGAVTDAGLAAASPAAAVSDAAASGVAADAGVPVAAVPDAGVSGVPVAGVPAAPAAALRDPFALLLDRPSRAVREAAPESADAPLAAAQQRALGARSARDLRVTYDGVLRSTADELVGAVAGAASVQEAIHRVMAAQDATGDPLVYQGCTRLMTALTQGSVALHDRTGLRAALVGDDPLAEAVARARGALPADPRKAADILAEALAEAESGARFADTAEAVHRFFDGYASRLAYNLAGPDDGREVELVPPSLVLCYLDAINLLDESFAQSEAAVAYGRRCIELAPTFSLAYRRCARAYMLVGDLESAADLLVRCLAFTTSSDEIAMAYYQLAYVEWKAGRAREGLACYCKSIMASPVYAPQASVELHELMREEGLDLLPRDQVDDVLDAAGIPVAPVGDRLVELEAALRAAVDANLFAVGRSLLAAYLQHRPDDALAGVLRSLGGHAAG